MEQAKNNMTTVNSLFARLIGSILRNSRLSMVLGSLEEFSTIEHQFWSSSDLLLADGVTVVLTSNLGSFSGDPFEKIVNHGVHSAHALLGHTYIGFLALEGIGALQYLKDIGTVRFNALHLAGGSGGGWCWHFKRYQITRFLKILKKLA